MSYYAPIYPELFTINKYVKEANTIGGSNLKSCLMIEECHSEAAFKYVFEGFFIIISQKGNHVYYPKGDLYVYCETDLEHKENAVCTVYSIKKSFPKLRLDKVKFKSVTNN